MDWYEVVLLITAAAAGAGVVWRCIWIRQAANQEDTDMALSGRKRNLTYFERINREKDLTRLRFQKQLREEIAKHQEHNRTAGPQPSPRPAPHARRSLNPQELQRVHDILSRKLKSDLAYSHAEKKDARIWHAYWKQGGLRFYTERLLKQLREVSPDADAEALRVDLYHSLIEPVQKELARLRQEPEPSVPPSSLEAQMKQLLAEQPPEEILAQGERPPRVYTPRCTALFEALTALYEGEDASLFAPVPGGAEPSRQACLTAVENLTAMAMKLLEDYALPL